MNPFNQQDLNQINPQIKSMYNAMKSSNNPEQLFIQMASNNPTLQPIAQALQSGANPEQLFYQLCSSKGIDPSTILNQLK